jgi:hypothetical protein
MAAEPIITVLRAGFGSKLLPDIVIVVPAVAILGSNELITGAVPSGIIWSFSLQELIVAIKRVLKIKKYVFFLIRFISFKMLPS